MPLRFCVNLCMAIQKATHTLWAASVAPTAAKAAAAASAPAANAPRLFLANSSFRCPARPLSYNGAAGSQKTEFDAQLRHKTNEIFFILNTQP